MKNLKFDVILSYTFFTLLATAIIFASCAKKPPPQKEVGEIDEKKRREKEEIIAKAETLTFEQAKSTLVPDPYVMFGLGLKREEQKKFDDAEKFYSYTIELKPDFTQAWVNLAELKGKTGKYDEKIKILENAMKIIPRDPLIWASLASAYADIGNTEKAESKVKDAIKEIGMSKEIAKSLGYIFFKSERYSLALFVYQDLQAKYPDDPDPYFLAGEIYFKVGNCLKAIQHYSNGLKLKKDKIIMNNLGLCYFKLNAIDDAQKVFEEIISIDKEFLQAYVHLGIIYKRKGEFEKSAQMYKKALEIQQSPDILYNLANLYETMASYYRMAPQKAMEYINYAKSYLDEYSKSVADPKEKEFIEKRKQKLIKVEEDIQKKLEKELKKPK